MTRIVAVISIVLIAATLVIPALLLLTLTGSIVFALVAFSFLDRHRVASLSAGSPRRPRSTWSRFASA